MVVGDTHGNAAFVRKTIVTAADAGISRLVQLGDFGIWPGHEGERFLEAVSAAALRHDVRVEFLDGNHDDHDQLDSLVANDANFEPDGSIEIAPGVHYWRRGSVVVWHGRRIGFLGGAVSLDRFQRRAGVSWWPQESTTAADVARLVANTAAHGGRLDVLCTHDMLPGISLPTSNHWPVRALDATHRMRRLLRQAVLATGPQLYLHGHMHIRYRDDVELREGDTVTTLTSVGFGHEGPGACAVLDLATLELDDLGLAIRRRAELWERVTAR